MLSYWNEPQMILLLPSKNQREFFYFLFGKLEANLTSSRKQFKWNNTFLERACLRKQALAQWQLSELVCTILSCRLSVFRTLPLPLRLFWLFLHMSSPTRKRRCVNKPVGVATRRVGLILYKEVIPNSSWNSSLIVFLRGKHRRRRHYLNNYT